MLILPTENYNMDDIRFYLEYEKSGRAYEDFFGLGDLLADDLNALSDLAAQFGNNFNLFDDIIVNGLPEGVTAEDQAAIVENDWFGYEYTELKNDAWARLLEYYEGTIE